MYKHYYINDNQTSNPGLHHEVHTKEHAAQLGIRSKQYVGYYANEVEAVAQAKKIYSDADGCAICCPDAHRGVILWLVPLIMSFTIPMVAGM